MNKKRPFIVTFIGDVNIIGSLIILLLAILPKSSYGVGLYSGALPNYLRIPFLSQNIMQVLIAIFFLITAFEFLRLKKWSYWAMVSFNTYMLVGWAVSYFNSNLQSVYSNPISIIISLVFIIPTKKYFNKSIVEE